MSNAPWYSSNIKALVLSDVLNWKTSEKSYEDLCERFGNHVVSKAEYQELFMEFTKEVRDFAKSQIKINEIIFNESMYLRYRILQDVISKVPVNTSYERLCWVMEDINYHEFEFWYYRFYNGQRDLDYDRSKNPKPLTFYDLPTDVIERIVEKSEIKSRYKLRAVSRGLRSLVDSSVLRIGTISFIVEETFFAIHVDDVKKYILCPFLYSFTCPIVRFRSELNDASLATLIRNPKLHIESLDIKFSTNLKVNKHAVKLLKSIPHQLHVRNLRIWADTKNELIDITHCMKPKILKKLEIGCRYTGSPTNIYGIAESEQWKQSKEITISNPISGRIAHFSHFKSFDICLSTVSLESMLQLRDAISEFSNFEWCIITRWGGISVGQTL